jgi:hypothetical protein
MNLLYIIYIYIYMYIYKYLSHCQMRLVRVMSEEFINTLDKSAKLFKTYQMAVHKEKSKDCDKRSFFSFLVKNPLQVHFVQLHVSN